MELLEVLFKDEENEKGQWIKVGVLLLKDDGRISIKLDTVPVGNKWNGWLVASKKRIKKVNNGGDYYDEEPF